MKKIVLILLLLLVNTYFVFSFAQNEKSKEFPKYINIEESIKHFSHLSSSAASKIVKKDGKKEKQPLVISKIINLGKKFLGKPYRYRGKGTGMLDCSGLWFYAFRKNGINIPRTALYMHKMCKKVKHPKVGDFIFFRGTRRYRPHSVGHVALIVAIKKGVIYMMHSCSRGILIENFTGRRSYEKRFISFGRVPELEKRWKSLNNK